MVLPWAGRIVQIGYVVPDLDKAIRFFHEDLGIEKFLVRENTHLTDQYFRGVRSDFRQSLAFCYSGDVQIEIIQPLTGPSTYTEFLERQPQGGVQHLGYRVDNLTEAKAVIEARGYRAVQGGSAGETTLAYFEAPGIPTTLIELLEISPQEVVTFERLHRGEIGNIPGAKSSHDTH